MTILVSALRAFTCRVPKIRPERTLLTSRYINDNTYQKYFYNTNVKSSLSVIFERHGRSSMFPISAMETLKNQKKCCAEFAFSSTTCERSFHTTSPQKALPPALWIIVRPVMNIAAFLFGRTLKKWWQKLPQEKRTKLFNKLKKYKYHIFGFLVSCAIGMTYFYLNHLETHPLSQRSRFILFSQKDMQRLCQTVEDALVELSGSDILPASNFLYRRVERVMCRIMEANRDDIVASGVHKWKIYVFNDSGTQNAMVLPNGTVFIYSGIMNVCTTDDDLGTVLSHEIAHTLLNHQGEMMSRQHFFDGFLMLLIAMLWAVLPDAAALVSQIFATKASELLIHLPFSRQMESEADSVGLKMAAKACFDVRAASAFWAKMEIIGNVHGHETPDEFLSTHPAHETRQKNLDELIPDALKLRDACKCPSLIATDPRLVVDLWRKQFEAAHDPNFQGVTVVVK